MVATYNDLMVEYGVVDPARLRGYGMHKDFANENELNMDRIQLAMAALLCCQMNALRFVKLLA